MGKGTGNGNVNDDEFTFCTPAIRKQLKRIPVVNFFYFVLAGEAPTRQMLMFAMELFALASVFLIAISTGAVLGGPSHADYVDAVARLEPGAIYGCQAQSLGSAKDLPTAIGDSSVVAASTLGIALLITIFSMVGLAVLPVDNPVQFHAWWKSMRGVIFFDILFILVGWAAVFTQLGYVLEVAIPSPSWEAKCEKWYSANGWKWEPSSSKYTDGNLMPDIASVIERPGPGGLMSIFTIIIGSLALLFTASVTGYAARAHENASSGGADFSNPDAKDHSIGLLLERAGLTKELMASTNDDALLFMALEAAGISGPADRLEIIKWAHEKGEEVVEGFGYSAKQHVNTSGIKTKVVG